MKHTPETQDIYRHIKALCLAGTRTDKRKVGHGAWWHFGFAQASGVLDFYYDDYAGRAWVVASIPGLNECVWMWGGTGRRVEIDRTDALHLNWDRLWAKINASERRAA